MNRQYTDFAAGVYDYYQAYGRHDLLWRRPELDGSFDPYKILVSEIMLQQTQVPRVVPKFKEFIARFPTLQALAAAPLSEVLKAWSGLGYNRRAKFLWQAAEIVVANHGGQLPHTTTELTKLPGIGTNTAGAILAYAFNQPALFVETNIRTVFIHHCLADKEQVSDTQILDLLARTMPDNPRLWYWALMDYGSYLKQTVGNLNKLSKHYTVQSKFHGSRRQIRGQVLRTLGAGPKTFNELSIEMPDARLAGVLDELCGEQLITKRKNHYTLYGA
ncbi:MAG TPA: hypothetical protein VLF91_02070 [Candidatus Saccharimonadales bacterium]|nr:hypothetical protein [Candidatus Saccharimonadales bacterium]